MQNVRRRLERKQLRQIQKLFALLRKRRNKQMILLEEKAAEEGVEKDS